MNPKKPYVDHYFSNAVISLTNPELVGMANRFRLWEKNDFNSFSWFESFAKYDNVPRTYWVLFAIKIFFRSFWECLCKQQDEWFKKNKRYLCWWNEPEDCYLRLPRCTFLRWDRTDPCSRRNGSRNVSNILECRASSCLKLKSLVGHIIIRASNWTSSNKVFKMTQFERQKSEWLWQTAFILVGL